LLKSNKENLLLKGIIKMPIYNGTNGNDNIIGSTFTDSIFGLGGDDTLNPGSGVNDYIDGGTGVDLLVADYSNVSGPYSFSFDNIEKVSFKGSNGDDNFTFNNTTDTLYGNGGNDTLNAGAFDDYLDGGSGSDSLFGGDGNDSIYGGAGNDTLYGGLGADKFGFYFQSEGIDIIKDFNKSEGDKIEIKLGFGANSLNQFSYNSSNGALFFDASSSDNVGAVQLATIENKPSGFSVQQDIIFA
jgi:serralysin